MKHVKLLLLMVSGMMGTSTLFAQEQLSLQQAIRYALEHKVEAQKSKLEIDRANYKIDETRAGALPQISGNGALNYNPLLQKSALPGELMGMPGETILVAFGQPWQSNVTLNVDQQIFNQALFTGLKAAATTREFYLINKDLTDEQVIEKVANAYYEVFQADQQLKTLESNLENTIKNQKVIKGLVDAGLAKKIDLDRTTVAINNLEAQKQQLKNALQIRENALKFAIGMEMSNDVVLPNETFDVDAGIVNNEFVNVSNLTEIRLLEKQTELHALNKKATLAEYYPTLSLTGNLGYMGLGQRFPIFSSNPSVNWFGFSTVGLNLRIPIFNGGSTRAKARQVDVDIMQARADIEDTKLALNLAVSNATTQIRNSLLTINSNRENVELAKSVLGDTENNYQNGLATLTELLDAENAYADAQNNYTSSLLDYKIAEVQLIKAKGELKSLINE